MKVIYQIKSEETGKVLIRRRKIARALRWWLREKRLIFSYDYYIREF
ncbi:MAG: hypothetical protein IQL11_04095 [Bacteroidales bacterium]|nr:hypothetical protein [Bacteroidales bacterium]